jgi:hypothetical protein
MAAVAAGDVAAMMTEGGRGDSVAHTATQQPHVDTRGGLGSNSEPRRPQRRKLASGWVFGASLGAFFVTLALLAFQLRAGQDPALGATTPVAQQQPRKVILKRRLIERIVVDDPAQPTASPPSAVQTSEPTTTAAPAPAPAPLTTQSS